MPTPLWIVVIGKNLSNVSQALLSMVVSYLLGSLLFGYPLALAQPLLFFVALLFGVLSLVAMGLMLAPAFIVNPMVQRFQNAMEYPVYILSGFLFPIALLPGWTTPFSYILAPYWAARILHATATGSASVADLAFACGAMTLLGIVYLVIAALLFRIVLYKARVEATLGMDAF
jgi:ABC-2 type transport system permease protein